MSSRAQGQVVRWRRGCTSRYGFRFTLAGRRHCLALGTDREGRAVAATERAPVSRGTGGGSLGGCNRSLSLAERVLIVLGGGFVAGDPAGPGSNGKAGR
jgi:hypothetical protein